MSLFFEWVIAPMMTRDTSIVFCLKVLFCLFCFLSIEDNKISTLGVTEDYVERTKLLK